MDDLLEPMLLWLPSYMVEDREAVADVTKANGLVMDFRGGDISVEEFYDGLNDLNVDLDDYSGNLERILRQHGV